MEPVMKRKKWSVLISAAAVVVAFAGCDASGTTASGSAGTSASAKAFAEKARALVAAASGEIPTHGPTTAPAIEPHKKIVTIPCSAGAQGCKFAVDRFAAAAKAVGWTTTMIDPAGDPAKMAAAVNQAVSEGADGIYSVAIDSANLKAPFGAAKAAGVHTVCFSCVDDPKLLLATLPDEAQLQQDGYVLAAKAFLDSGENLKAVLMRDSEFGNTIRREQGVLRFIDDCRAAGASCTLVAQQNFLVGNISTSVPQQVAALLRNKPDWNALIAPYDATLLYVLPELRNSGLVKDGQRAYGFDPLDQNISWIRDNDVEAATVASPYDWIANAAIDELNRAFSGQPAVDEGVTDKLVSSHNAPAEGKTYVGDGDPAATYAKLWGLS
ncbi:substrate-binding domain-containing protein [Nocardioides sp. AN3]